jgi:hypothetical protein
MADWARRASVLPEPFDRFPVGGDDGGGGAVAFDDELVDVGGVERVEGLKGEVVDLCRRRHRSTYAEAVTMPTDLAGVVAELVVHDRQSTFRSA